MMTDTTTLPPVEESVPQPDWSNVEEVPAQEAPKPPKQSVRERLAERGIGIPNKTANESKTKTPKSKKAAPRYRKGMFVEPLTQIYGTIGMALLPIDPICAQAIIESAEQCATSLDELAEQNQAVRRTLAAITQTNAVGAVLIAHFPILMAVTMHHVPKAQSMFGDLADKFTPAEKGEQNSDE